jgi:hypothetical protein
MERIDIVADEVAEVATMAVAAATREIPARLDREITYGHR